MSSQAKLLVGAGGVGGGGRGGGGLDQSPADKPSVAATTAGDLQGTASSLSYLVYSLV